MPTYQPLVPKDPYQLKVGKAHPPENREEKFMSNNQETKLTPTGVPKPVMPDKDEMTAELAWQQLYEDNVETDDLSPIQEIMKQLEDQGGDSDQPMGENKAGETKYGKDGDLGTDPPKYQRSGKSTEEPEPQAHGVSDGSEPSVSNPSKDPKPLKEGDNNAGEKRYDKAGSFP